MKGIPRTIALAAISVVLTTVAVNQETSASYAGMQNDLGHHLSLKVRVDFIDTSW